MVDDKELVSPDGSMANIKIRKHSAISLFGAHANAGHNPKQKINNYSLGSLVNSCTPPP